MNTKVDFTILALIQNTNEANNDKKLITLVKEVEENCRQQNKYLDWIKLVGITPILNEEIEEVIDSFSNIND